MKTEEMSLRASNISVLLVEKTAKLAQMTNSGSKTSHSPLSEEVNSLVAERMLLLNQIKEHEKFLRDQASEWRWFDMLVIPTVNKLDG